MEFKPAQFLEEAILKKDIFQIRIAVSSYISKSPSNRKEILDIQKYIEGKINGLMEEHDNEIFELDKSKWDKDYFAMVQTKLMYNFSQERVTHLLDVGEYVFGKSKEKETLKKPMSNPVSHNTQGRTRSEEGTSSKKLLWVIGGVVLLTVVLTLLLKDK